ncbi:fimbrial protein [Photorhabdus cinerea]|uniref:Type 1 fimbrial protein n=1 Tax=Photorhabdus cinerea TaxID=471575 RepID=A0A7X5QG54_9GAMM|nr:fimbrial protein [Photorhabdus cinerea]NHB93672.1 hypothetical protein [Photorhabdus cinerea]
MKKILKISVVAALVLGVVSAANAADNAVVTVTGMILAATCDVTNPGSNGSVDTGNHRIDEFAKPGDDKFPSIAIAKYIPKSERHFTIRLANCDANNTDASKVKLYVTGNTLEKADYLFNAVKEKKSGIALSYLQDNKSEFVKNGTLIPMNVSTDKSNVADIKNSYKDFTVYIASYDDSPENQSINAPITFSYAYN